MTIHDDPAYKAINKFREERASKANAWCFVEAFELASNGKVSCNMSSKISQYGAVGQILLHMTQYPKDALFVNGCCLQMGVLTPYHLGRIANDDYLGHRS